MDKSFPEIKTFFGFGCMRLPMKGTEVDIEQFKEMTDYFIENGFNYFDTAHGYPTDFTISILSLSTESSSP